MLKYLLITCLLGCLSIASAQKKTSLSAVMDGYSGKYVMFEFMHNPDFNKRYDYIANNPMELEFELDKIELVKINQWVWVFLEPGDKLDVAIDFNGRTYKDAKFEGTPKAVKVNQLALDTRNVRIKERYKMNPLAAYAIQTEIEDYAEATLRQWDTEKGMLLQNKKDLTKVAYDYLFAELQGTFLSNYIKYPAITAGGNLQKFKEVAPQNYCKALNDLKLLDNEESLQSQMYMTFLLDYKDYVERCKAMSGEGEITNPSDLKAYYNSVIDFYKGNLRDAALFVFLYSSIVSEKDFDVLEELVNDYAKNYNKNKELKTTLLGMLK